jgi:hypothetical protein
VGAAPVFAKLNENKNVSHETSMIAGEGNDTSDAVGRKVHPPACVHVNVGVKESAWALGTPMARHSTASVVHNDFPILMVSPLRPQGEDRHTAVDMFLAGTFSAVLAMLKRNDLPTRGTDPHQIIAKFEHSISLLVGICSAELKEPYPPNRWAGADTTNAPAGGWRILKRLRRLRVAHSLRFCFVQRVGNFTVELHPLRRGASCYASRNSEGNKRKA